MHNLDIKKKAGKIILVGFLICFLIVGGAGYVVIYDVFLVLFVGLCADCIG